MMDSAVTECLIAARVADYRVRNIRLRTYDAILANHCTSSKTVPG